MTTFSLRPRRKAASTLRVPPIRRMCHIETLEARKLLSITPHQASAAAAYGQLPLSFEANQGQTNAQVNYLAHGEGYSLFLTPSEAVLGLALKDGLPSPSSQQNGDPGGPSSDAGGTPAPQDVAYVGMQLVGGNSSATATGESKLAGVSNYLVGNDPSQWQTGVANYGQVSYSNVYPGINLVYYGNQQQLEYDFDVAAGADPGAIKLEFPGAQSLSLDSGGNLILQTAGGPVTVDKPNVYQTIDGARHDVSGSFTISGQQVGFQLGPYDHSQPLVIDPSVAYGSYLGGKGFDPAVSIAVDSTDDAYVTGTTFAPDFPVTGNGFNQQFLTSGVQGVMAFVTKFSTTGDSLVYSTFLGGTKAVIQGEYPVVKQPTADTGADSIAVDPKTGNAYVTGATDTPDFPVTSNAWDSHPILGIGAGFLSVLNAQGNGLVYSTDMPASAYAVTIDTNGNAYVTGATFPGETPNTGGFTDNLVSKAKDDATVGFVQKVNPFAASNSLVYSDVFGGATNNTFGKSIAVDGSGEAYVVGGTSSSDLLAGLGATGVDSTYSGGSTAPGGFGPETEAVGDAFAIKFSADGSKPLAATYLGGAGDDVAAGVALNAAGDVFIVGSTDSTSFSGAPTPVLPANSGDPEDTVDPHDAFVAELTPDLGNYLYMTFLGGNTGPTRGEGIAVVDNVGNAYVVGETGTEDFPIVAPLQEALAGALDGFLTELDTAGKIQFSTLLGGSVPVGAANTNTDLLLVKLTQTYGMGIALDGTGSMYVTGATTADDLVSGLAGDSTPFQAKNFGFNAFVLKVLPTTEPIIVNSTGDDPSEDGVSPETGNTITLDNGKVVPEITLRSAIEAVDAGSGHYIAFAIPNRDPGRDAQTGAWVIVPASALPDITATVNIDATTQPGFGGTPVIVLDGSSAGASADGFFLQASSSHIQGFAIDHFGGGKEGGGGINVAGDNDVIDGNYIGVDESGKPAGNAGFGIFVSGSNERIGGPFKAPNGKLTNERNIISANSIGIELTGSGGNIVEGNYVGGDISGETTNPAFGNPNGGILVESQNDTIGGDSEDLGNLIQGASAGAGIDVKGADSTTINGNIIGLLSGTTVTQSGGGVSYPGGNEFGVLIEQGASDSTIGPEKPNLGNIIAGNILGVEIEGEPNAITIQNNLIGAQLEELPSMSDLQVQADPSNWDDALSVALTGQSYPPPFSNGMGRLGNGAGIAINSSSTRNSDAISIVGNDISTNQLPGVEFLGFTDGVSIAHNTISENGGSGIVFAPGVFPPSTNDNLLDNSVFNNGGLGVDLLGTGAPLPRGKLDFTELPDGANHLLQAPELTGASTGPDGTQVAWGYTEIGEPSGNLQVEFFATDPRVLRGQITGEFVLGTEQTSRTAAPQDQQFPTVSRDALITAMVQAAVDDPSAANYLDTSEYSNAVPVVAPDNAVGPSGSGDQHFVNGADPGYTVVFENPATATAPAQTSTITDQLDANLDSSTFSLGDISVGGVSVIAPAGSQSFSTQLDLTATQGVLVNVSASLDTTTGKATWTFTSIDPKTGKPPTDPSVGFLPPNTDGVSGEIFVTYTVTPKAGLATGTVINCQAQFSMNGGTPITSPTSFNTIDSGAPTSSVATLAAVTNSTGLVVNWSGQDDAGGSGIASFDVYVSDNGGPFTLWQSNTTAMSAVYNGQFGHTYGFYSVATDNVGNVQATPKAAQATTQLEPPQLVAVSSQDSSAADRGGAQDSTTELYDSEGVIKLDDVVPTSSEISSDGRYFVFTSSAPNLVPGVPTPHTDTFGFDDNGVQVYRYDRLTGTISLVSDNTSGGAGDDVSFDPVISADGRYVAFISQADDLVPNFVPNPNSRFSSTDNVYVRDMQTGTIVLASPSVFATGAANEGIQSNMGNVGIKGLSISANGQFVSFACTATDVVSGVTLNSGYNVFVRDLVNQKTTAADPVASGQPAQTPPNLNGDQGGAGVVTAISADGRYVAFSDNAANLVNGVTMNSGENVYVRDLVAGTTTLATVNAAGIASSQNTKLAQEVTLSADGRYVLFASNATDLVSTASGGHLNVYLRDLLKNTTTLVSVDSAGDGGGNGDSQFFALSGNEQSVSFESKATNLAAGATGVGDVYVRNLPTGTTTLVSVDQAGTAGGNKASSNFFENGPPAISDDGTIVAFASQATNLAANTPNAFNNLFVRDLANGTTTLVTANPILAPNQDPEQAPTVAPPLLTPDGKTVFFASTDIGLLPNTGSAQSNVYLSDWQSGALTLVSAHASGLPSVTSGSSQVGRSALDNSEAAQYYESTSSDGRYVVYTSTAAYLVPGAPFTTLTQPLNGQNVTNPVQEVYVHDLTTGANSLVSVDAAGTAGGNSVSASPVISGSGQFVAFVSDATNLASDATNGNDQVFVRNLQTGVTTLVSAAADGSGGGDGNSGEAGGSFVFGAFTDLAISADGRYVVFASSADNLVAGVKTQGPNLFLRDMQTGATTLITPTSSGTGIGNFSITLAGQGITPDGNHILFESNNPNVISGTTAGGGTNLFLYDVQTGSTTLVSVGANGSASGGSGDVGRDAAMTPDGRYVAFASSATNFVSGGTKNTDIYLRDLVAGTTTLVSDDAASAARPSISADGQHVVYVERETSSSHTEVYVYDVATGQRSLVSANAQNTGPGSGSGSGSDNTNFGNFAPLISANGEYVVFTSDDTNLTSAPNPQGNLGVYLRDLATGVTTALNVDLSGNMQQALDAPVISPDGGTVAFDSTHFDNMPNDNSLLPGDFSDVANVYAMHQTSSAPGMPGSVTGQVSDASGTPVADALVFADLSGSGALAPSDPSTTTDANGKYALGNLAPGQYEIAESTPQGVSASGAAQGVDQYNVDLPANGIGVGGADFTNTPSTSLSIDMTPSATSVSSGTNATFTITVTNNGPGAATGVSLNDTLPANGLLLSATPSQGSTSVSNGVLTADMGDLSSGNQATLTLVFQPESAGTLADTAQVAVTSINTNAANNSVTKSVTVTGTFPGVFSFSSETASVADNVGTATITVNRVGSDGTATVDVSTADSSGKAGTDYTTTDKTLSFGPGVTTQTFTVPILVDSSISKSGVTFFVSLSNASSGASVADPATETVTITPPSSVPPPTSSVAALPKFEPNSFTVTWSGTDSGGPGIASYSVFVSDNGGSFTAFKTNTTATSATFTGQPGHTYGFYSVAADTAGNTQATPTSAQATTTVPQPPTSSVAALPQFEPTSFTVSWSGTDTGGPGIASFSVFVSDNGGSFTAFKTDTTATSASFTGQPGHTYGFYSVATDTLGNAQATPDAAQATTTVQTPSSPTLTVAVRGPSTATVGADFTYTITVTNSGMATADNVLLTDQLDGSLNYKSSTSIAGASGTTAVGTVTVSNGLVSDNLGSLAAGATDTLTITVTPNAAATVNDQASVTRSNFNAGAATNSNTVSTTVTAPGINNATTASYLNGQAGDNTAGTFVHNLYRELLGREPEAAGQTFWLNVYSQAGGAAAAQQKVVAGFLASPEYRQHLVSRVYVDFLHRAVEAGGLQFWTGKLAAGQDEKSLLAGVVGSDEYFRNAGGSAAKFVDGLFHDLLGRSGSQSDEAYWAGLVHSTDSASLFQIALEFLSTPEAGHKVIDGNFPGAAGSVGAPGTPAIGAYALADITGNGWENLYFEGNLSASAVDAAFASLQAGTAYDDVVAGLLDSPRYFGGCDVGQRRNESRPI